MSHMSVFILLSYHGSLAFMLTAMLAVMVLL